MNPVLQLHRACDNWFKTGRLRPFRGNKTDEWGLFGSHCSNKMHCKHVRDFAFLKISCFSSNLVWDGVYRPSFWQAQSNSSGGGCYLTLKSISHSIVWLKHLIDVVMVCGTAIRDIDGVTPFTWHLVPAAFGRGFIFNVTFKNTDRCSKGWLLCWDLEQLI